MYFLVALFGFIAGILGGMGMGGGTLLIPLLGFLDIPQHATQAANLISFIPMALFTLSIHKKNGLMKNSDRVNYMILTAVVFAVIGSVLSGISEERILKICFGILLLVLGVIGLVSVFNDKKEI